MKRKTAESLVKEATSRPYERMTWVTKLSKEDQSYVSEVIEAARKNGNVAPYLLADSLRKELQITACRSTMARYLKEKIDEKA